MKLKIISVGNKMPAWVSEGVDEYLKRLMPMMATDMVELTPAKRHKNPSPADIDKYKQLEGENILAQVGKDVLWVLEVKGKMISTEQLATRLDAVMQGGRDVSLVIGGADGVSIDVLSRADFKWSLSDLTLPHPMVRVILVEQLYRAMSILNNHPYHRGG